MRIFRVGLLVGKTSKWTITDVWMHLTQREKKVENGDFGRKLGKVKSREMVLSEKMRLFELASSSFFHLLLTIFLLCYFELFPVTGAGINLFQPFSPPAYTQVRSLYIAVFRTFSVLSASTINPEFTLDYSSTTICSS